MSSLASSSGGGGGGGGGGASGTRGSGGVTGSNNANAAWTGAEEETDAFIIIETSFKVVAFTRSPLRIALLSIFVDLTYMLPNVIVGRLTRQSIVRALENGLDVADVAAWFARHAHPQVLRSAVGAVDESGRTSGGTAVLVPYNVLKQMGLWADERTRLTGVDVLELSKFTTEQDLREWAVFCRKQGILVHESRSASRDPAAAVLYIRADGEAAVVEERKRRIAASSAATVTARSTL